MSDLISSMSFYTMSDTSIIAAVLVAAITFALYTLVHKPQPKNAPPNATVGMFETMSSMVGVDSPWFLLNTAKATGASIFKLNIPMPGGLYIVGDAKAQREIFLDKTTDKSRALYKSFDGAVGCPSLLTRTAEDPRCKPFRKGVMPAFASSEISRMNSICNKYAQKFIGEVLEPLADTDKTFDPGHEFPKLVFHSVMEASFEYSSTDEEYYQFSSDSLIAYREYAYTQSLNPLRKIFGAFIPTVREARRCGDAITEFGRKILRAYQNNPNKSTNNTAIKLIDSNPHYHTELEKIADVNLFLIGGFDTTGYTMASTVTLLAKHPETMKHLQKSLLSDDAEAAKESMAHVITESNRMAPVTALGSARKLNRDFVLLDETNNTKVELSSGSNVFLPHMLPHRNGNVFKNPDEFSPKRWETATNDMLESMMTFAHGSRNCAGQSLAKAELFSVMPKVLSKYEFEVVEEGELSYFMTWKYVGTKLRVKRINP